MTTTHAPPTLAMLETLRKLIEKGGVTNEALLHRLIYCGMPQTTEALIRRGLIVKGNPHVLSGNRVQIILNGVNVASIPASRAQITHYGVKALRNSGETTKDLYDAMVEAVWVEAHEEHEARYPTTRDAHHRLYDSDNGAQNMIIRNHAEMVHISFRKGSVRMGILKINVEAAVALQDALADVILAAKTHEDRS